MYHNVLKYMYFVECLKHVNYVNYICIIYIERKIDMCVYVDIHSTFFIYYSMES